MKSMLLTGLCVVVQASGAVLIAQQALQSKQPPSEEKIARLIKELDDDKFSTREIAKEELLKIGEPVIEPLREVFCLSRIWKNAPLGLA